MGGQLQAGQVVDGAEIGPAVAFERPAGHLRGAGRDDHDPAPSANDHGMTTTTISGTHRRRRQAVAVSDTDDDRYERGMARYREVYGQDAVVFERGQAPFFDLMIEQLFAEVWTRPALSTSQRRLISMGVVAARGRFETLRVQFEIALRDGELTPEQVREFVIHIIPYVGYPYSGELHATAEAAITQTS